MTVHISSSVKLSRGTWPSELQLTKTSQWAFLSSVTTSKHQWTLNIATHWAWISSDWGCQSSGTRSLARRIHLQHTEIYISVIYIHQCCHLPGNTCLKIQHMHSAAKITKPRNISVNSNSCTDVHCLQKLIWVWARLRGLRHTHLTALLPGLPG